MPCLKSKWHRWALIVFAKRYVFQVFVLCIFVRKLIWNLCRPIRIIHFFLICHMNRRLYVKNKVQENISDFWKLKFLMISKTIKFEREKSYFHSTLSFIILTNWCQYSFTPSTSYPLLWITLYMTQQFLCWFIKKFIDAIFYQKHFSVFFIFSINYSVLSFTFKYDVLHFLSKTSISHPSVNALSNIQTILHTKKNEKTFSGLWTKPNKKKY